MVILPSHGIHQARSLSDWPILFLLIVLYVNLNAEYQSCYVGVDDDFRSIIVKRPNSAFYESFYGVFECGKIAGDLCDVLPFE